MPTTEDATTCLQGNSFQFDLNEMIDMIVVRRNPNLISIQQMSVFTEEQKEAIRDDIGAEYNTAVEELAGRDAEYIAAEFRRQMSALEAEVSDRFRKPRDLPAGPWTEQQAVLAWMGYDTQSAPDLFRWAERNQFFSDRAREVLLVRSFVQEGIALGILSAQISPSRLVWWMLTFKETPSISAPLRRAAERRPEAAEREIGEKQTVRALNHLRAKVDELKRLNKALRDENLSFKRLDIDKLRPALALLLAEQFPPKEVGSPILSIRYSDAARWLSKKGVEFTRQNIAQHVEKAGAVLGKTFRLIDDPGGPETLDPMDRPERSGDADGSE